VRYAQKEALVVGASTLCNNPALLSLTQALDKAGYSGELKSAKPAF
jgi:hypothetical protein